MELKVFSLFLLLTAGMAVSAQTMSWNKDIATYEAVHVDAPAGTAPRLPYQLWVTYADGTKEYRQVRWTNAAPATELAHERLFRPIQHPV